MRLPMFYQLETDVLIADRYDTPADAPVLLIFYMAVKGNRYIVKTYDQKIGYKKPNNNYSQNVLT